MSFVPFLSYLTDETLEDGCVIPLLTSQKTKSGLISLFFHKGIQKM